MVADASRLRGLAERTPASRERYVDFLRAFSIAVVVLGHWLGAVLIFQEGRIGARNVLNSAPWLWAVTWLLQVMPIFFFVGGFSNFVSLRSCIRQGQPASVFLRARARRLLAPSAVFIGAWAGLQVLLHAAGVGGGGLVRLSWLPFGPLWFLAVYIGVVATTPLMAPMHRRYGTRVVGGLTATAVLVDVLRFAAGITWVAWINLAVVWILAHQIGFLYADGTLLSASRSRLLGLATGGLGGLILLSATGIYPLSMVGTGLDRISNMNPPTLPIVALTFWLVGLAMLARGPVTGWLSRPRAWMAVIAANRVTMTVYLWHLTALVAAALVLHTLGIAGGAPYWVERPVIVGVSALVLAGLAAVFARVERVRGPGA